MYQISDMFRSWSDVEWSQFRATVEAEQLRRHPMVMPELAEIEKLAIRTGDRILAIKAYRDRIRNIPGTHDTGLKACKDVVDGWAFNHGY